MLPTRLNGRYELLERLGEGGVAIVYRAQDTLLDRVVAVKILREQFTADPAFLARFRREAQAAARLSHPNIIAVFDVGQDENLHYIVMEYVDGQNLKALLTPGPLPVGRAFAIAEQVCAALDHAHQQGFVHRDIKPQNILVVRETGRSAQSLPITAALQTPLVKVADFGLARSLNGATTSDGGVVLGTVQYVSPEQARGEPATPASDIYSLGVVLYEMLTGRLPFESESPIGLALKHIQEQPLPPSRLNPRLPPTVDGLVLRALAKQPQARYSSAAEMGTALASYRQFGEAATGQFRPVKPVQPTGRPTAPRQPSAAPGVARPQAKPQHGFDWLLLILFLVTFVAIAGLVPLAYAVRDTVFPPEPTPLPQVKVPDLIGLEQAVAESQLQALGLTLVVQEGRYDDKVPPQRIIAQLVPANTYVAQGEQIAVIVSRGREQVKVPPLIGLPLSEAQTKLNSLGLRLQKQEVPNAQVKAGFVTAQEPAAETQLERGSSVRLTVSAGDRVVVPNVFGKPETEAQRLIREAGLATTFANAQAPEDEPAQNRWVFGVVPVGSVISQTPEAGTLVDRGTVVQIAIRKR